MRNVVQQSFVVFTIGEKSYTVVYQKYMKENVISSEISIQNKAEMSFQMERHRTYFRNSVLLTKYLSTLTVWSSRRYWRFVYMKRSSENHLELTSKWLSQYFHINMLLNIGIVLCNIPSTSVKFQFLVQYFGHDSDQRFIISLCLINTVFCIIFMVLSTVCVPKAICKKV